MSVIIRLQRLPWSANAADVRSFFAPSEIPDGGVHIVGGKEGDAFIAFATDEDARKAMQSDGERLKGVSVKLLLSSRKEMNSVIEQARQEYAASANSTPNTSKSRGSSPPRASPPPPPTSHFSPSIRQNQQKPQEQPFAQSFKDPPFKNTPFSPPTYRPPQPSKSEFPQIWANQPPSHLLEAHSAPAIASRSLPNPNSAPHRGEQFPKRSPDTSWRKTTEPEPFRRVPDRVRPDLTDRRAPLLPLPPPGSVENSETNEVRRDEQIEFKSFPRFDEPKRLPPLPAPPVPPRMPPPPGLFPPGFFPPGMRPPMEIVPTPLPPTPLLLDTPFAAVSRLPPNLLRKQAIAQFFLPMHLSPDRICMILGPDGVPGMVYVKFASSEECNRAVKRNGENGIRIRSCPHEEAIKAFETYSTPIPFQPPPPFPQPRFIVELSNLPFRTTESELRGWLGQLQPMSALQARNPDGGPSDRWFVEFGSQQEGEACISNRGREFRGRSVQCVKTTPEVMAQVLSPVVHPPSRNIEFGRRENFNGKRRSREPERRFPPPKLRKTSENGGGGMEESKKGGVGRTSPFDVILSDPGVLRLGNLAPSSSHRDIEAVFRPIPLRGIHFASTPGVAYVELAKPSADSPAALKKDGCLVQGSRISVKASLRSEMEVAKISEKHEIRSAPIHPPDPPTPSIQSIDPEVLRSIGAPGCVIAVQNLPPRIGLEELCNFFAEYPVKDDSVRMHYNDNGDPTGDCLLALKNREDVEKAIRNLNGASLSGHRVSLHLPISC